MNSEFNRVFLLIIKDTCKCRGFGVILKSIVFLLH